MGKNSSGSSTGGGGSARGINSFSMTGMKRAIDASIKDPRVAKDLKDALDRMNSEFDFENEGIVTLKFGKAMGAYGMNQGHEIELNKGKFNRKYENVAKDQKARITSGYSVETKNVVAHTLTHELAHSVWSGGNSSSADKQIHALYNDYMKSASHKGWGTYSRKNAKEFFAEGISKHLNGTKDKYSTALYKIAKGLNK